MLPSILCLALCSLVGHQCKKLWFVITIALDDVVSILWLYAGTRLLQACKTIHTGEVAVDTSTKCNWQLLVSSQ